MYHFRRMSPVRFACQGSIAPRMGTCDRLVFWMVAGGVSDEIALDHSSGRNSERFSGVSSLSRASSDAERSRRLQAAKGSHGTDCLQSAFALLFRR